jgi:hypothetical protein
MILNFCKKIIMANSNTQNPMCEHVVQTACPEEVGYTMENHMILCVSTIVT